MHSAATVNLPPFEALKAYSLLRQRERHPGAARCDINREPGQSIANWREVNRVAVAAYGIPPTAHRPYADSSAPAKGSSP